MVAPALPLCVAIQSKRNEKYLSYVKEGKAHKHVRFSGEEIVSRSTKFAIERSRENKELIHLRCFHNNKYLVKKSKVEQWIIAAADNPVEDISVWSSTLFEPILVKNYDGYGQIILQLKHVQSKLYACLMIKEQEEEDSLSNCLYLGSSLDDPNLIDNNGSIDVFNFIDWGTLVILPKSIAFKSNTNGKYLMSSSSSSSSSYQSHDIYPCVRSASDDKADARVIDEVLTHSNGTISIKCREADGLWTVHDDCEIDVEPPLNTNDEKASEKMMFQEFSPIKISSNVISLRCPSLNKFCEINGSSQQLECKANSILKEAKFVVEEVVASRAVYDIEFHLNDARIYDEVTSAISANTISNPSEETLSIPELVFKFKDKRSSSWTNGGSLSLGVKAKFSSEGVPFISENGSIVMGEAVEGEYEWGEIQTEISEMEKTYSEMVSPKTQSTVRLMCTQGTCDVPFSYTVREVYVDGSVLVYDADDGVYTAMNFYDFRTGMKNKPI